MKGRDQLRGRYILEGNFEICLKGIGWKVCTKCLWLMWWTRDAILRKRQKFIFGFLRKFVDFSAIC